MNRDIIHGVMTVTGNMAPYITSYIINRIDPSFNQGNAIWISAIAFGIQGVSMPLGGILAKKTGPRLIIILSCLINSCSVIVTYFSINVGFWLVLLTYSATLAVGFGLCYSVVIGLSNEVSLKFIIFYKWFPDRKGLVTGLIVGGFGAGALIFTPIQTAIINPNNIQINPETKTFDDPTLLDNIPKMFLIVGSILLCVQLIGMSLIRIKKSQDDLKEDDDPRLLIEGENHSEEKSVKVDFTPKELFREKAFYMLWFLMLCQTIPITLLSSYFKLFGQIKIKDDRFLSIVATCSSIFNSAGRILWGIIIDKISFKPSLVFMLLLWATAQFTFPHLNNAPENIIKVFFPIWVMVQFFCMSCVFVVMPSATSNIFGQKNFTINYGIVFFAFALGSIICAIGASILVKYEAWVLLYTLGACINLIALLIVVFLPDRKIPSHLNFFGTCTKLCFSSETKFAVE